MGWRKEEAGRSAEVVVPPTVYEWGNGGGGGISNFGTRLSEMWESYELIPRLKFRTSRRLGIDGNLASPKYLPVTILGEERVFCRPRLAPMVYELG